MTSRSTLINSTDSPFRSINFRCLPLTNEACPVGCILLYSPLVSFQKSDTSLFQTQEKLTLSAYPTLHLPLTNPNLLIVCEQ